MQVLKVHLEKSSWSLLFFLSGLGHYNITSVPTKLHGDIAGVNIIHVSSYGDCCLAVSDEGDVFGWGNSEYLQLASVTETTQVSWGCFFMYFSSAAVHRVKNYTFLPVLGSFDSRYKHHHLAAFTWPYKTHLTCLCSFRRQDVSSLW